MLVFPKTLERSARIKRFLSFSEVFKNILTRLTNPRPSSGAIRLRNIKNNLTITLSSRTDIWSRHHCRRAEDTIHHWFTLVATRPRFFFDAIKNRTFFFFGGGSGCQTTHFLSRMTRLSTSETLKTPTITLRVNTAKVFKWIISPCFHLFFLEKNESCSKQKRICSPSFCRLQMNTAFNDRLLRCRDQSYGSARRGTKSSEWHYPSVLTINAKQLKQAGSLIIFVLIVNFCFIPPSPSKKKPSHTLD